MINLIYKYLISNQIFSAVICGILINYLWAYVKSEHERYSKLVYLQRILGADYGYLLSNRDLIIKNESLPHLVLNTLLFSELIPIDLDSLVKIKHMKFLNENVMCLFFAYETLNKTFNQYGVFLKDMRANFFENLKAASNQEQADYYETLANDACQKQLKEMKENIIKIIELTRDAFAKVSVLTEEDQPIIIRLSSYTSKINKWGREIIDVAKVNKLISIFKKQDEACGNNKYNSDNTACHECELSSDCKKYYSLKL